MGSYTANYQLYMAAAAEQGWGDLVNGNFETIDTKIKESMDAAAAAAKTAEWANISGKPLLMGLQPLSFTYTSPDSIFDDDGIAGNLVLPFPYFVAVGGKLQYSVTFGGIVSRQLTIKILDHGGNVITTFSKTGTGGSTYSGSGTFTKSGLASQIVVSVDKLGYPADKIVFTSSTGVYNLSVI